MTEQNIKKEVKKIGTKALLGTLAATSAMNPMVLEGLISEAYASDEIDLSQDYTDTVDGVVYTWTASTKTLDIEGNGASIDIYDLSTKLSSILHRTTGPSVYTDEEVNIINVNNISIKRGDPNYYAALFQGINKLKKVTFNNVDTSQLNTTANWFADCASLIEIEGLETLDTSSVVSMEYMFSNCSKLTNIDVSNFNTSLVTNMSHMFAGCKSLTEIDVSNFDTSRVTNMIMMFCGCSLLTEIKGLENFDTSSVENMGSMFNFCESLENIDVSNFNTSKVTNMWSMFGGCTSLTEIKGLENFDTSLVTDMNNMFMGCGSLKELNVSNFDTSSVTDMRYMFSSCELLKELDVSNFDTSSVTNMSGMFQRCLGLKVLDLSNFDTSSVTNMRYMLFFCYALKELNISSFDTSQVTDMSSMFESCYGLTELDVSNFDTSAFDTSGKHNMSNMFKGCYSLIELDLSNFKLIQLDKLTTIADDMLKDCSRLDIIHLPNNDGGFVDLSIYYNKMGVYGNWYDKNNTNDLTAYQFSSDAANHLTSADCGKTIQRGRNYKVNYYVNNTLKDTKSGNFRIGATPSGLADNLSFDKSAYVVDEKAYSSESEWGFRTEDHLITHIIGQLHVHHSLVTMTYLKYQKIQLRTLLIFIFVLIKLQQLSWIKMATH